MAQMKANQGQGMDAPDSSDDEEGEMPALESKGGEEESKVEQPTASGSGAPSS